MPGDFTVVLGAVISGRTHRELVEGMEALGGAGAAASCRYQAGVMGMIPKR